MEEKNQETPLMSEFCEAIMERTADLIELKSERDCALLLCSDGDTLACRLEGNAHQVSSIISKKMLEDPVFAYCVGLAVNIYIVQKSCGTASTAGYAEDMNKTILKVKK